MRGTLLLAGGLAGPGTDAGLFSEDLSGTGLLIFFFILCFFDILPLNF
jgi:hypothetical protein